MEILNLVQLPGFIAVGGHGDRPSGPDQGDAAQQLDMRGREPPNGETGEFLEEIQHSVGSTVPCPEPDGQFPATAKCAQVRHDRGGMGLAVDGQEFRAQRPEYPWEGRPAAGGTDAQSGCAVDSALN